MEKLVSPQHESVLTAPAAVVSMFIAARGCSCQVYDCIRSLKPTLSESDNFGGRWY